MKQRQNLRAMSISLLLRNVFAKLNAVKSIVHKIPIYSLSFSLSASLALAVPGLAHAADARVLAMRNSTQLLNDLNGVVPEAMEFLLPKIENGKIRRIAPTFPVWIISSDTGKLMYYQGQKEFKGQAASRLVDDKGFRFGQHAVDQAHNSRSSWMTITLAGQEYPAYCGSKAPFVVCTLVKSAVN